VKEKEEKKEEKKASKKVKSTRTPKKKPKKEKAGGEQVAKWEVGDVLEAEMGLVNDYEGTFHKVRVIDVLEGNSYRCQFLAFCLDDVDVFLESKLHKLFEAQPDGAYEVGDDRSRQDCSSKSARQGS
jgi:hypothetical protein